MRYFIGFLVAIGLIILLIVLIFGGGGGSKKAAPSAPKTLISYANTDATVQMTIDGPINDPQDHQQVQITVGRDGTTFEQLQGYDGSVVNSQSFPNTVNSYGVFLHALALAGFSQGDTSKSLADDRGYCALGDRDIFELNQDGQTLERFWATSCGKPKTYLGNQALTMSLFEAQIPNYDDLTQNVSF